MHRAEYILSPKSRLGEANVTTVGIFDAKSRLKSL